MFRRRRGASTRPPASSAWWPAADLPDEDARPPLPSGDPFGGWPAFPPPPADPAEPGHGRSGPVMGGWGGAAASAAYPNPSAGRANTGVAGWPGAPAPGAPGSVPRAPGLPGTPGLAASTRVGSNGHPLGEPAEEHDAVTSRWTPLLTHADDSQPFAAVRDEPGEPERAARPGGRPERPRRAGGLSRVTRRRAERPRRTAEGRRGGVEPAAEGSGQLPAVAPPPDPVLADGITTWLDPVAPPNPMEAAALAGAFAADYLSWDESCPARRGEVLAQYLPSDVACSVASAALLGWSGKGRQRAEFALPGAVHPDGDGRVVVDVRVRVTPYRAVGRLEGSAPVRRGELEVAGVPAVAPAPIARGWKSLDSYWVRMTVPITYDQGRLVVDTWDEQLDQAERADNPDSGEPTRAEAVGSPRAEPRGSVGAEPGGSPRAEPGGSPRAEPAERGGASTGAGKGGWPEPGEAAEPDGPAGSDRDGRSTADPATADDLDDPVDDGLEEIPPGSDGAGDVALLAAARRRRGTAAR